MEDIQARVSLTTRTLQLNQLVNANDVNGIRNLIADLVEQAHLAGYNGLSLISLKHPSELKNTGIPLVAARNYCKSKGLRI